MRKLPWQVLSILALSLSACVTVPNTKACAVKGILSAGAICAETLTGLTSEMTFDEFLTFLEAQPDTSDPNHLGEIRPGHAAAIVQSADDWNKQKTALEQACRELGNSCSYQIKEALARMQAPLVKLR